MCVCQYRTCWVCFASEEDDRDALWVRPCRCRGTNRWVHQMCLQRWVDEKQRGNSTAKVLCPQCNTEYLIIFPKLGRLCFFSVFIFSSAWGLIRNLRWKVEWLLYWTSLLTATECHLSPKESHSITCHPTQVNTPRCNPSQTGWYSIYLPQRDGRLSWPRWLITYRDGLPAHICAWVKNSFWHWISHPSTYYPGIAQPGPGVKLVT